MKFKRLRKVPWNPTFEWEGTKFAIEGCGTRHCRGTVVRWLYRGELYPKHCPQCGLTTGLV